jgi:hypothetical protein
MGRYCTKRYVAVAWSEAVRLARLDQTPLDEIQYSPDVTLIHRTEWWAWWSDQRITTAIGLPDSLQPQGLSPGAVSLIEAVFESSTINPTCGWATLAEVRRVLEIQTIEVQELGGIVQRKVWRRLVVEFGGDRSGVLYQSLIQYEYGYLCDFVLLSKRNPSDRL